MEYLHAAILLHNAGKPVNEDNLTKVLTAAGINADSVRVKALVASLAEVNIEEALKSTPAIMPAVSTAPAEAPAAEAKPSEEKKKEDEKKKEEEAIEGLGALFG
ncbi:MAG: 50S ribosomal protein P1 [Candidatus Bathyarchaeota archaeon]|jgi:large subunit ribosomal protein L12|nr:50S ribosomal protein P1 [Candidatus Bathyarchaeota archaeon]UCC28616.1 MAG: 50S ribosomal protein P1 [Candidatus Bathyarchaeota archaeon]UCD40536.1 MAG: 50S ribosomal protein P1 [Candidatus Bathyarchaeota archaeon]